MASEIGHLNFKDLPRLKNENLVNGLNCSFHKNEIKCIVCEKGKIKQLPFRQSSNKESEILGLIHSDICGPFNVNSLGGAKYFVTFIDDHSRYIVVMFLKSRDEVLNAFKTYMQQVEREANKKIKKLRTDNAREYISKEFSNYLKQHGIQRQFSIEYTPQQNGIAERANRTIMDMVRCMFVNSNLPKSLWAEAVNTAVFIRNRCPTNVLNNKTPYEVWTGRKPHVGFLKTFGCRAVALEKGPNKSKLDPKGNEYIFVGYCTDSKGFRLWDGKSKSIVKRRDVKFFEKFDKENYLLIEFEKPPGTNKPDVKIEKDMDLENEAVTKSNVMETCIEEKDEFLETNGTDDINSEDDDAEFHGFSDEEYETAPEENGREGTSGSTRKPGRPRLVRTGRRGRPKKLYKVNYAVNHDVKIPETYEDVANSSEKLKWIDAMQNELLALKKNKTWILVDRPKDKNILSNRWVFSVKTNNDGSIEKYKARLVARGCEQRSNIDYDQVFSPVARYESIRILFAICAELNMYIHQMDVITAFVQGELDDEIYMQQPKIPGEICDDNKVCRLLKPLYGLKQASRQWHMKLDTYLKAIGLQQNLADTCVYTKFKDGKRVIVVIYVDDLLIASDCLNLLTETKRLLSSEFEMKDLGEVNNILGIAVKRDPESGKIEISQRRYTEKLLEKYSMENSKPVSTPMDASCKLTKDQCPSTNEEIQEMSKKPYRELVGSIIYLANTTRPDIAFAANVLSRFCTNPGETHWTAAKRVLRYLKGTKDHKIIYQKGNEIASCYVDSDWGSNHEDRKSHCGYVLMLGNAPVCWKTVKQKSTALSTMEAEYMALSEATKEVMYFRKLLSGLKMENLIGATTTIYCDNQSTIILSKDSTFHSRSKHIDIRYHFCREKQEEGLISVEYVSTENNPADILTKALVKSKFEHCVKLLKLSN